MSIEPEKMMPGGALPTRPPVWAAAVLLGLVIGIVYVPALGKPFIYDDRPAIVDNNSILKLWPLVGTAEQPGPLRPPQDNPMSARPLVNFTLAVNYYFGQLEPAGYQAVNVFLHFLAAVLLWAIARRTLCTPYFAGRFERVAGWLALAVAVIWALHPLHTETVIYTTQRTELLMGVCYLATVYCCLRYWEALPNRTEAESTVGLSEVQRRRRRIVWWLLATLACACGMASKEVMVSTPLMVLFYERTFITRSLAKAWRQSCALYVGLAATWVPLLLLSLNAPRGKSAGFHHHVPAIQWWLTQSKMTFIYLKLAVWPWPLQVHYDVPYLKSLADAWMYVVPLLLLGAITLVLLWKNTALGFLVAWAAAILSPTFVIPVVTEIGAERRMYLPLAAIVAIVVVGSYRLTNKRFGRTSEIPRIAPSQMVLVAGVLAVLALALVYGLVDAKRLTMYDDEVLLWQDVVAHQPQSAKARSILAGVLTPYPHRMPEALEALESAISLDPKDADLRNKLGIAYIQSGRLSEGVEQLQRGLELDPNYASLYNSLGIAAHSAGQGEKAIELFRHSLVLDPLDANAHSNLGVALAARGEMTEALAELERAAELKPHSAQVQYSYAVILREIGRTSDAIERYRAAVRLRPHLLPVYAQLAETLAGVGRSDEAIQVAEQGIEMNRKHWDPAAADRLANWLAEYKKKLEEPSPKADFP